eukprot:TRINITY_DN7528_c0_g1_i12.p4 TRINITY_DN7528_c0_g1~~TRINITY_DN7528_c0_g1_i12.p4  ORF type:complete len:126 (-),score=22.82 TRINITY_DN7528_c0_g1_i12:1206-1583(-)
MTSQKGVGIPIKLLHEAVGHTVTIELKTGETFRGDMISVEDNWNLQLKEVTATARDGRTTKMEHIFVRGSHIRFAIVPDMLKNAPMFKRVDPKFVGKNLPMGVGGRGRAAAARASINTTQPSRGR